MALVAHSDLPAFTTLSREGLELISSTAAAERADIPALHIGFLNLMPDAALEATERQFMRLLAACDQPVHLYVHLFTVAADDRSEAARAHIAAYYEGWAELQGRRLDAMIITGANPAQSDITREAFWRPMIEVIEWGRQNVRSILFSCLATHAVLKHYHQIGRVRLPQKRWGVYSHRVLQPGHGLVRGLSSPSDGPHSHFYDVSREQMERAGWTVLMESDQAGVYLATSSELCEFVFFQGHPEYDAVSLLKEYKREVTRYIAGERDYPPYPQNYLPAAAIATLEAYKRTVLERQKGNRTLPGFPEEEVSPFARNTWSEPGRTIYRNWLSAICREDACRR